MAQLINANGDAVIAIITAAALVYLLLSLLASALFGLLERAVRPAPDERRRALRRPGPAGPAPRADRQRRRRCCVLLVAARAGRAAAGRQRAVRGDMYEPFLDRAAAVRAAARRAAQHAARRRRTPSCSRWCSASCSPSGGCRTRRLVRLPADGGRRALPRRAAAAAHPRAVPGLPAGRRSASCRRCASLVIGLTLYNGAVIAEIVRAGVLAIPKGQSEAAMAIGLGRGQTLRLVLLPQAVRVMLPALVSQLVVLLKDTSLGFVIGYPELLRTGGQLVQVLEQPAPDVRGRRAHLHRHQRLPVAAGGLARAAAAADTGSPRRRSRRPRPARSSERAGPRRRRPDGRRQVRPRRSRWPGRVGGEVVNADSMQLYRGMDIGTAKLAARGARRACRTTCSTSGR